MRGKVILLKYMCVVAIVIGSSLFMSSCHVLHTTSHLKDVSEQQGDSVCVQGLSGMRVNYGEDTLLIDYDEKRNRIYVHTVGYERARTAAKQEIIDKGLPIFDTEGTIIANMNFTSDTEQWLAESQRFSLILKDLLSYQTLYYAADPNWFGVRIAFYWVISTKDSMPIEYAFRLSWYYDDKNISVQEIYNILACMKRFHFKYAYDSAPVDYITMMYQPVVKLQLIE